MTAGSCDHGITLGSYREVCAECKVEIVHRPSEEPALRATVEALREALEGTVRFADGSAPPAVDGNTATFSADSMAEATRVLTVAREALASTVSDTEEGT